MKHLLKNLLSLGLIILSAVFSNLKAQTLEWRLSNPTYSSMDEDGDGGPAKGKVSFTLQIHTQSGTINDVTGLSVGWSYQSAKAMIPAVAPFGPGCPANPPNNPANVVISPAFQAGGFTYSTVNQCGTFEQTTGGQVFDKRAVGTLEGSSINLTTDWVDVFTVTLWALGTTPEGGYVVINSGSGGSPGGFPTYEVSDVAANPYVVNSLTYTTPLELSSAPLPVGLSKFDITCTGNGANLNWQTLNEQNSRSFEVERSSNGASGWTTIGTTTAAGNSTRVNKYEYFDLKGGTAYYRLRQVDKDGRFTYSNVEKVNCQTKQANIFLYPVPAKNVLNVVLSTERNSKVSILLVDISGKITRQINTDLQKGTNNLKVNISGLSSGEYILKVVGSEVFKTQKVTILN